MPLVRVLSSQLAHDVRNLEEITSFNAHGREYVAKPEIIMIDKERAGCRACGCPIDVSRQAVRVLMFSGHEVRGDPTSYTYWHAEDCWSVGFIQTNKLNGTNVARYVVEHAPGKVEAVDMIYSLIPDLRIGTAGHVTGLSYYAVATQSTGYFGIDDMERKQRLVRRKVAKDLRRGQSDVPHTVAKSTRLNRSRIVPVGAYMPDRYSPEMDER